MIDVPAMSLSCDFCLCIKLFNKNFFHKDIEHMIPVGLLDLRVFHSYTYDI